MYISFYAHRFEEKLYEGCLIRKKSFNIFISINGYTCPLKVATIFKIKKVFIKTTAKDITMEKSCNVHSVSATAKIAIYKNNENKRMGIVL